MILTEKIAMWQKQYRFEKMECMKRFCIIRACEEILKAYQLEDIDAFSAKHLTLSVFTWED